MPAGVQITPIGASSGGGGYTESVSSHKRVENKNLFDTQTGKSLEPKNFRKIMQGSVSAGMDKAKSIKKMVGKGLGVAGIAMSLSSLLRMSQVFTGTIGALFQVLGGFIDAILAPFMPIFAKMIGKLGEQIPKVQNFHREFMTFLHGLFHLSGIGLKKQFLLFR